MKKTAIFFPGQGSQYIGMGQQFLEQDQDAADLFRLGGEISGFPLKELCLDGPLEELTRVLHLQPALTVINLICWQQLLKMLPGFKPDYLAGHSLGEYSALHAAGVLSAADTLSLVTKRGELMEREGAANPGGMRAVLGLSRDTVEALLTNSTGPGVAVIANHNTPAQVVISGDAQGLDTVSALCQEEGGKVIPLQVSVANHSPLVAGAVADFADFMETVSFQSPSIPVFFNVTAESIEQPEDIRSVMARQIASPVRWVEIVDKMVADGVEVFVELGPKNVLTGMMRKILPRKSGVTCLQADTPERLQKVVDTIAG
ncbi:ACP S-malonyltransferase [Desulfogranum marinum]|jgi:[acyl-carrier-protein] S-malonyltransferase|uniref:ACP S-malonyltransferase n=1 Tax=Desulfogranum marinum TaxID=453220 RepID=UPI0019649948|nr:ACP S-malonyltransferase [Desulfogranum marinum]MBM9510808.1 ACP S-malonyltransferase [Desulfogranum marinum]